MSDVATTAYSLLQLAMALIVVRWLAYSVYSSRRSGFELRPAGWLLALFQAAAAIALTSSAASRLSGYEPSAGVRIATAIAGLAIVPLLFVDAHRKWILRARGVVREPISQANTLLELGRLAPTNGARAFQKAFDLYHQAARKAPRSFAATYGCGLAMYESARVDPDRTNLDELARAEYWFKRALALNQDPEVQTLVADIDAYLASIDES